MRQNISFSKQATLAAAAAMILSTSCGLEPSGPPGGLPVGEARDIRTATCYPSCPPPYAVTALLPVGLKGGASSVNDIGAIAGWAIGPSGKQQAFYTSSASTPVTFIPMLWGSSSCAATDVNHYGIVVGECDNPERSFRWSPRAGLTLLSNPQSSSGATAWSINDAGQVVGTAHFKVPYGTCCEVRAVKWDSNGQLAFVNSAGRSTATVIDNWGHIAGAADWPGSSPTGSLLAAMWVSGSQGPTTYFVGEYSAFSGATWALPGGSTVGYLLAGGLRACRGSVGCVDVPIYAWDVSDKEKIVGTAVNILPHRAAYIVGVYGAVAYLPALTTGSSSHARGVNTCGTIVGYADAGGYDTPVVWKRATCD